MKKKDCKMIRVTATLLENDTVKVFFGFSELKDIQMDITLSVQKKDIEDIKQHLTPEEPSINGSVILEKDVIFGIYDRYLVTLGNYALHLEDTLNAIKDSMVKENEKD